MTEDTGAPVQAHAEPAHAPATVSTTVIGQEPPRTLLDGYVTVNGIVMLLGLIVSVLTILSFMRRNRRENESDADDREERLKAEIGKSNGTIDKRLTAVEATIRDFMPRAEIEAKVEHEKNNRAATHDALRRQVERHDDAISGIKVEIGRIAERQATTVADLSEIKTLLKEQGRDLGARIERLADAISDQRAKRL